MKRHLFLYLLSVCSSAIIAQNTIYVSSGTTDIQKGTSESPYGTIEEALKQGLNTTGNDTVHIRIQSGFYPLNQTLRIDKSPSVPVVIEGEGKDKPVISGAITLTSWEKTPEGWWKTHVDEVARYGLKIEQLYVNSFPVDERRPWSEIENMTNTSQMFRFTLLRSAGKPAGFITWWKLKRGIYVEHFAISPSMRSHGLGAMALKRFCAERGNSPVILEVEPAGSEPMADRRIGFYSRCGFKLHKDFDYIQPPYAPGLNPVRLQLMTYGDIGNLSDLAREIKQEVYGAENPD